MIAIVDYQMSNLGSIVNMLRKIGTDPQVASCARDVHKADKIILPGVGAFASGMRNLCDQQLVAALEEKVLEQRTPILGICLGMQLLTQRSQEGACPGLGWIEGEALRFDPSDRSLKVPHMGWNHVEPVRPSPLFSHFTTPPRFYFVHSYYVACVNPEDVVTTTTYGRKFVSSFQRGNIFGVQFHPEKSHRYGLSLLQNFVEL